MPQLESESSASGQVIKNEQVTNLPLNVRQFMQMVFLTPFSVPATRDIRSTLEPRDTTAPTAGGQRPESNNYQIDGFDDREGGLNNVSVSPSVDSIGEFKVQSGMAPAEFGRTSGTVINVVTKSGTNAIHGNAYEFLRNDVFDARPFFGTTKSPLRRNQFGASLGGPLVKDKLLYFGNYEGYRQRSGGVPVIGRVPSLDERAGIFATRIIDPTQCTNPRDKSTCAEFPRSGNSWTIPQSRFSAISAKILDLWPLPNATDPARNFRFQPPSAPIDRDNYTFRGDYNPRATDTYYVRYVLNDESVTTPERFPNRIGGRTFDLKAYTLGGHYSRVFSPRFVNDVGYGFMHYRNQNAPFLANGENLYARVGITNVLADTDPLFTGSPSISIPGYLAPGEATPNFRDGYNHQLADNVSWQRGTHALKWGGEVRYAYMDNYYTGGNGSHTFGNAYTLNNFADYLLGFPSTLNKTARGSAYGGGMY
ncbi:MAG: hypothetical protein DMG07_25325 [Acidobacteria bacterium]|nr:MAG: hypothetical protein DMG07_25325 [Acidobacteriota bacterium]